MSNSQDKISVTLTMTREIALELEGAIEFFLGCSQDPENERSNEREIERDLIKVKNTIGRAAVRNKKVN